MRSDRWISRTSSRSTLALVLLMAGLGACARARPVTGATPGDDGPPATPAGGRGATTVESANTLDVSAMDQPVGRVEELFIGRFPGVQVFNVNGQVQVRIRGASSINGSGEPLILVDGQQLTPGSGGLISLNPRDIKRIEVLKDAVSLAEFGVRGGNGVIKITTKRP